ncbi:MAG: DUF1549 domain-containing protein, partial [Isosphaeraceae bacterium]|nr:DUF1549 domain-containing protein [Isosphaeraceae bacterium]
MPLRPVARPARSIVAVLLALSALAPWARGGEAATHRAAEDLFRRKVYPLLQAKCLGCHGDGEDLESELDLRTREAALRGGVRGPALVPGDPGRSLLYQAASRQGDFPMPPKAANRLSAAELADLKAWIEAGAPWAEPTAAPSSASSWTYSPEDTWAFRPIGHHPVPWQGIDTALVQTPIDAFLLQKLAAKDLRPAPLADRVALIRRATYDLTGLPPTPEEVDA